LKEAEIPAALKTLSNETGVEDEAQKVAKMLDSG